jgi:hypothetical protein
MCLFLFAITHVPRTHLAPPQAPSHAKVWPMSISRTISTAACALVTAALSGCGVIAAYPLTSASLGVWGVTGKSPTDHAISEVSGKDCELMRSLSNRALCQPDPQAPVQVVDKTEMRRAAPIIAQQ